MWLWKNPEPIGRATIDRKQHLRTAYQSFRSRAGIRGSNATPLGVEGMRQVQSALAYEPSSEQCARSARPAGVYLMTGPSIPRSADSVRPSADHEGATCVINTYVGTAKRIVERNCRRRFGWSWVFDKAHFF